MKKCLFISLVSVFLTATSNAQFPVTPDRSYTIVETLYSANAEKLASEWISDDFFLDEQERYSTGPYSPNANLLTKSNPIKLPALEDNQKIILQVRGFYQVTYIFHFFLIHISTDGGENFKRIGIRTGRETNWDEDFDLSEFAEKEIIISFNLIADDIGTGEGLSLNSVRVIVAQSSGFVSLRTEKAISETPLLYPNPVVEMLYLNKDASASIDYIEIYDASGRLILCRQGDKDAVNVAGLQSGIYYLRVKDTAGYTYGQPFIKK